MKQSFKPYPLRYKPFIYSTLVFAAIIFIPIYTDIGLVKLLMYGTISVLFTISTVRFLFALLYNNTWPYHFLAYIFTAIVSLLIVLFCCLYTLGNTIFGLSDTTVIYTRKNNPHIIITSRYFNEGAFGGGTEPSDYQNVISVSYFPHFKFQAPVDVNKIDTSKWVKSR